MPLEGAAAMLGGQGCCSQGFVPEMGKAATNKTEHGEFLSEIEKKDRGGQILVKLQDFLPWRFQNTN